MKIINISLFIYYYNNNSNNILVITFIPRSMHNNRAH